MLQSMGSQRVRHDCVTEQQASTIKKNNQHRGFPRGSVVKNPPANAGVTGSIPGPGRSHMLWSN